MREITQATLWKSDGRPFPEGGSSKSVLGKNLIIVASVRSPGQRALCEEPISVS